MCSRRPECCTRTRRSEENRETCTSLRQLPFPDADEFEEVCHRSREEMAHHNYGWIHVAGQLLGEAVCEHSCGLTWLMESEEDWLTPLALHHHTPSLPHAIPVDKSL